MQTVGLIHQSRDQKMDYNVHRHFFLNFRFNYGGLISEVNVGYRSSKTKCVVFFKRNVVPDVKQNKKCIQYSLFIIPPVWVCKWIGQQQWLCFWTEFTRFNKDHCCTKKYKGHLNVFPSHRKYVQHPNNAIIKKI